MNYPIYIFFGLAPSIIWLLFFLRKDSHPESNSMILKVFFFGMLAAFPAALIELGFAEALQSLKLPSFITEIIYVFFGIALIEEFFKYFVVKKKVIKNSECDEPTDIMLYMIISALGFAALENLIVLLPLVNPFLFFDTFVVSSFRFVGATFLHALASGIFGYFMVLSFFEKKNKTKLFLKGLFFAVFLHGLYDFSIIKIDNGLKFAIPVAILIALIVFVSMGFKKVGKLSSVCKT